MDGSVYATSWQQLDDNGIRKWLVMIEKWSLRFEVEAEERESLVSGVWDGAWWCIVANGCLLGLTPDLSRALLIAICDRSLYLYHKTHRSPPPLFNHVVRTEHRHTACCASSFFFLVPLYVMLIKLHHLKQNNNPIRHACRRRSKHAFMIKEIRS